MSEKTRRFTDDELGASAAAWNEVRREIADDYADADLQAFAKWAAFDEGLADAQDGSA